MQLLELDRRSTDVKYSLRNHQELYRAVCYLEYSDPHQRLNPYTFFTNPLMYFGYSQAKERQKDSLEDAGMNARAKAFRSLLSSMSEFISNPPEPKDPKDEFAYTYFKVLLSHMVRNYEELLEGDTTQGMLGRLSRLLADHKSIIDEEIKPDNAPDVTSNVLLVQELEPNKLPQLNIRGLPFWILGAYLVYSIRSVK